MPAVSRCAKLLVLAAVNPGAAAVRGAAKEAIPSVGDVVGSVFGAATVAASGKSCVEESCAEMPQNSLQGFEGKTAYDELCSWVTERELTKTYNKVGCVENCASMTIDCKTDKDNLIHVTYWRHKVLNQLGLREDETKYGIQKDHKSMNGNLLLFESFNNGKPGLEGCNATLNHNGAEASWCEAPKWTVREDAMGDKTMYWSIVYTWLFWDEAAGQYVLAEDQVKGTKEADVVLDEELRSEGLPDGVKPTGPTVEDWYTVGVYGWTQACDDNDQHKGVDFPIEQDKVCHVDVFKMYPGAENDGKLVKATWSTKHLATVEKKRFESSR